MPIQYLTPCRTLIHSKRFKAFKEKNAHITVTVEQANGKFPEVQGFYRTNKVTPKGGVRPYSISLRNMHATDIMKQLRYLNSRTATGGRSFVRPKTSPTPTVQGFWHPELDLGALQNSFEALDLAALEAKQSELRAASTTAKV